MNDKERAYLAEDLARRIAPILAGNDGELVGAVLADLTATWLAGYHPPEIREPMLMLHIELVWQLVPLNAAMALTTERPEGSA